MAVMLGYVAGDFHALIARDLYLPEEWLDDPVRRKEARIPDEVLFRTKPDIALEQIDRAQASGVPLKWIVADEAYGGVSKFRNGVSGGDCAMSSKGPVRFGDGWNGLLWSKAFLGAQARQRPENCGWRPESAAPREWIVSGKAAARIGSSSG